MKANKPIIIILFLLFAGLVNTQAAYNDCLLHVFQAEINEKGSDELYDYFYNRSEEDLKKAYEAWMVLYQADKKVDRLNIENLETVYAFMASAEKNVEEMVENIKLANGFESWKNLDYQFQKEGYTYVPDEVTDGLFKRFNHKIQKNGEIKDVGDSRITPAGILHNSFDIPNNLQGKGISKAIYKRILLEDIREIKSFYADDVDNVNFKIFMDTHNALGDLEKAAMATPQGKVLEGQFTFVNARIQKGTGVFVSWKRIENIKAADNATEPWMNDLPSELRDQITDDKGKLLDLFKNADPAQREKLGKAWEVFYKADKNVDRLDRANLDELSAYLGRTDNIDEVIEQISNAGGYEQFKKTVYWQVHLKDTSKRLNVKDGMLTVKDCEDCAPLAKIDNANGQLNLDEIEQWLPIEISSVKKVGKLEGVNYYQDRLPMAGDIDIVEDINSGRLYLSDGNEQLVQKALLNPDFKSYYKRVSNHFGKDWRSDFLGLSEEAMIDYYAGNTYARFNSALIQKSQADDVLALEQILNNLLDKVDATPGTYYRGIGKSELNRILQSKVGDELIYDNFLSTSASKKTAASFAANKVIETGEGAIVEIMSKNGKQFSDPSASSDISELEVLHKSKSEFIIDKVEYVDGRNYDEVETALDGYYRIVLREKGVAKPTGSNSSDTWINELPTQLRQHIFAKKDEIYELFKNANAAQREKLIKSWEALKNSPEFRMPEHLKIIAKLGEKFRFQEERGYKALELVLSKMTDPDQQIILVESLGGLDDVFYNINDLPMTISFKQGEFQYILSIIDGIGDEVMEGLKGFDRKKIFKNVDNSYETIGEYEGISILKKGNEIGFFKAPNVLDFSTALKYQFQREGYTYKPDEVTLPSGVKEVHHYIQKGEESINCGVSRISPNGIVSNELNVPENLREKGISKAIYDHISVRWGRIGESEVNVEPWINSLPAGLREDIIKHKGRLYILFKEIDEEYKQVLLESWKTLRHTRLRAMPEILIMLSQVSDKFELNGEQGFKALSPLFKSYTNDIPYYDLEALEKRLIESLFLLRSVFKDPDNLPISFTCVKNSTYFDAVLLDGVKDKILEVNKNDIVRKKFFQKIDSSYEKVGEFNGFDIFKKGNELGFKPEQADDGSKPE